MIEVGMASLILVVGFVGIIQAVTIGSQMIDTAQKQQVAVQIIDAEIERLRSGALDASSISGLTSGTAYTITVDSAGAVSGNTAYFALSSNTAMSSLASIG